MKSRLILLFFIPSLLITSSCGEGLVVDKNYFNETFCDYGDVSLKVTKGSVEVTGPWELTLTYKVKVESNACERGRLRWNADILYDNGDTNFESDIIKITRDKQQYTFDIRVRDNVKMVTIEMQADDDANGTDKWVVIGESIDFYY